MPAPKLSYPCYENVYMALLNSRGAVLQGNSACTAAKALADNTTGAAHTRALTALTATRAARDHAKVALTGIRLVDRDLNPL